MSKPECRESREVPYNANAIVWECAAAGVLASADVDTQGRLESPTAPARPRLLPYQRQLPPGVLGGSLSAEWGSVKDVRETVGRTPMAPVSGNEKRKIDEVEVVRQALGEEVHALERRVESLSTRVRVQNSLIRGFCKLEISRKG